MTSTIDLLSFFIWLAKAAIIPEHDLPCPSIITSPLAKYLSDVLNSLSKDSLTFNSPDFSSKKLIVSPIF